MCLDYSLIISLLSCVLLLSLPIVTMLCHSVMKIKHSKHILIAILTTLINRTAIIIDTMNQEEYQQPVSILNIFTMWLVFLLFLLPIIPIYVMWEKYHVMCTLPQSSSLGGIPFPVIGGYGIVLPTLIY